VVKIKIGAITIGQTPRSDIISEIKEEIGIEVEIVEKGALDGLTLEEVKSFSPKPGDDVLVTKMKDGREVKIAEKYIREKIIKCVNELEHCKVDIIMLFCTGEFPYIKSKIPILAPDVLLKNMVKSIFKNGTILLVAPSPDQKLLMEKKWKDVNMKIIFESISPFIFDDFMFEKIAKNIGHSGADLVVLDCFGFNRRVKSIFKKFINKPIILPRALLGKIAKELI